MLTDPPLPARLGSLDLSANRLGRQGVVNLLDAFGNWPLLEKLTLSGGQLANIGDAGIVALADHPAIAQLKELDLSSNRVGSAGLRALIASPFLTNLRRLRLPVGQGRIGIRQGRALRNRFGSCWTGG
jgi:hypothetical protein